MTPPMYSDTPLAVLHTPRFETGKASLLELSYTLTGFNELNPDDPFTIEASHMALSHNAFIRGFNSIYQQAPRIQPEDKPDFAGYCLAWHDIVAEHHHYEETELFPAIEKAAGKPGLMDGAVEQHAAFHGGMEKFKSHLLEKGPDFSGAELIAIMDSFSEPLYLHLQAELKQIVALSRLSTPENPIDILKMASDAGTKSVTLSHVFNLFPVFFLNMETIKFEDGMWHNVFPPITGAVKWIMFKGAPMWQRRLWRFAGCTPDGEFKQLAV